MKSKQFLKNLAKAALLFKITILLLCFTFGCSSSTTPTFLKEDIPNAIQDICREEYKLDVVATLVGETLWIYIPVEDMFLPSDKAEKYVEKFSVEESQGNLADGLIKIDYKVNPIPDEEKSHEIKYNKDVQKKTNDVWKALRRVIFSLDRSKQNEPKFFCIITADIKNGIETKETFYYLDLKKVSYDFISWGEYYHRAISETNISDEIIGDTQGKHLQYKDITFREFLMEQIKQRIKYKFQKPEVEKNADIDKEIAKIVVNTLKIYGFKDFDVIELYNAQTKNRVILNKAAALEAPIEQRF